MATGNGYLPPKGQKKRRGPGTPPPPGPAPGQPPLTDLVDPQPIQRFRDVQERLRLGILEYSDAIKYNPWQAIITVALDAKTPPAVQLDCHKEIAQYLLPKLASIKVEGEVEHHHSVDPLQVLIAQWEVEEAQEREALPPWHPPGLEALDMHQREPGAWDLEEDEPDDAAE